jgi:hypothetical protein
VLNNRLERNCGRLLAHNQTDFVRGRYILESVVSAHKILHDSRRGQKGLVLKVDYGKAYDRVNCHFLEDMQVARGFGSKWVGWIMRLVRSGSISIRLNDESSPYFKSGKGLRQGDLLSLLFNLVIDVFTRLLAKAANKGYLAGFMNSIHPGGVINLQYVNDTLLFLEHNYLHALHLKWLMICFEHISGMKINYHKSDLTPVNLEGGEIHDYARIFCCKVGSFPFKYLGVPLHYEKLRREDIQPIVDKVINRIPGWKDRLLSYKARLILLKTC